MEVQKIPKRTVTLIEPKKSILVDKEKYHQKRVAAYCRVSTDSEEQLTSYQNQMRVYTEMIAARKEWEFAGLYADEAVSGTTADKRDDFQRLLADCRAGKIDRILVKSISAHDLRLPKRKDRLYHHEIRLPLRQKHRGMSGIYTFSESTGHWDFL